MLECYNVSYKIKDTIILNNLNIAFDKYKTYVIFGPQKSGFSTFVSLVQGQIQATSGNLYFNSYNYQQYDSNSLFQQTYVVNDEMKLFSGYTMYQNLQMYATLLDKTVNSLQFKTWVTQIDNTLEMKLTATPEELTEIEKCQFLALIGYYFTPSLFIVDNVSLQVGQAEWLQFLNTLLQQHGNGFTTVIYMTTDKSYFITADELWLMNQGNLLYLKDID